MQLAAVVVLHAVPCTLDEAALWWTAPAWCTTSAPTWCTMLVVDEAARLLQRRTPTRSHMAPVFFSERSPAALVDGIAIKHNV